MNIPPVKGPTLDSVAFEFFQNNFFVTKHEMPPDSENFLKNLELPNIKSQHVLTSEISRIKNEDGRSQIEMTTTKTKLTQNLLKFHPEKENDLAMPLVNKFIFNLRNAASLRNINQIKNCSILGDLSLFPEKSLENQKFAKNVFLTLLEQEVEKLKKNNVDCYFTTCFLTMDIFLNLNTAYFKKGLIERSRWKILSNYWKNYFKRDMITLIPILLESLVRLENSLSFSYVQLFKFLFFLKISTIQEICSRILEKFLLKEKLQCIMDLIKIFFISILVAHIFACFWFFMADLSLEKYQCSWILQTNLLDASWDIKYLYSIYWASVTMMTVGYGDITPQNEVEVVVCIVSVILGCAVYAYNISSIGMILQELNKENAEFNHKINVINRFMIRKNINKDLQRRIREYLRFLWKEENTQNLEEEGKIIEFLSSSLREELYIEAYGSLLLQDPLFFVNFSEKTLKKIVSKIKEIRLFPDEKIFLENEEDDSSIYFVVKGKIEIFLKQGNREKVFEEIKIGNHFGEMSFLDFTTLFSISRSDFLSVLEKNPVDHEKFCMIRDQILLYGNCSPIYTKCFCCKKIGNLVSVCPMLHFIPDREKIIKTLLFYNDQIRSSFPNRKTKRRNAFITKKTLSLANLKIQQTLTKEKTDLRDRKQSINSKDEEEEQQAYSKLEEEGISANQIIIPPTTSNMKEISVEENSSNHQSLIPDSNCLKMQDIAHPEDYQRSSATLKEIKIEQINSDTEKNKSMIKEANESENFRQRPSGTLEKIPIKLKSGNDISQKMISMANFNFHPSNATIGEFVFETVKNFKNYFPDQNIQTIIKNFNKKNQLNVLKNKEHLKKIMENKLHMGKYTFFVDEMRKHMVDQLKKRASLAKKRRKNGILGDSPLMNLVPFKNKKSSKLGAELKLSVVTKKLKRNSTLKKLKKMKY